MKKKLLTITQDFEKLAKKIFEYSSKIIAVTVITTTTFDNKVNSNKSQGLTVFRKPDAKRNKV